MTTAIKVRPSISRQESDRRVPAYAPMRSLNEAAGLLKDRYADLKRHYRKIRAEWPSYGKR